MPLKYNGIRPDLLFVPESKSISFRFEFYVKLRMFISVFILSDNGHKCFRVAEFASVISSV